MTGKFLLSVVGPTAIGKTEIAVALAKEFGTEILSADSRQFYREMAMGTAVPTMEQRGGINHHFLQHKSVTDVYHVGTFEVEALELLGKLFQSHSLVIMAGGSGLYLNAVRTGLDEFPKISAEAHMSVKEMYTKGGLELLQARLKGVDPVYYEVVDLANPRRLMRALEVCIGTGLPYSSFLDSGPKPRFFSNLTLGLRAPREELYRRIDVRVDQMMEAGLLDEVQSLLAYQNLNALQTVGYREIFRYLEGVGTLEEAVSEVKKNTRRFAKRQMTWFRKDESIMWLDHDTPTEEMVKIIEEKLEIERHEN